MIAALPTLAWLLLGQLPQGAPAALTADEVQEDSERHLAIAKGNALLRIGSLILHADEIHYAEDTHRFEIPGALFGVDGTTLLVADRAEGVLGASDQETGELVLHSVRIEEYRWLPPGIATRVKTADQVRAGRTLLIAVEARRLSQVGPRHYQLDGVRVSPCACTGAAKCRLDWALAAEKADVHAGDYALMDWPKLELFDFPVPLLRAPALYVPLSQRRTGFLLPHLLWQSQNGFLFDEPFYLTLGPSYDLTLSAGYITGASGAAGANGVQGPRGSVEFRYAPFDGTTGRLLLSVLDDRRTDPEFAPDGQGLGTAVRGAREALRAIQIQNLDPRDGDRLDLNLVSDARLTGQLTTDLLYAAIPATRSTASGYHRGDDWLLTLDGVFLQDFQGDFPADNTHGLLFGPGAPKTLERLPALTLDVPDHPLGRTPLWYSLTLSALREGPLAGGYDSLALSSTLPGGSLIPTVSVPQARTGVEQLDAVPTLSYPLQLGRFATGDLSAGWRQDVWLFENTPVPSDLTGPDLSQLGQRGYPLLDAVLGTELSRDFGQGDGRVRHTVDPEIEVRAIPFQLRSGTVPPLWLTPSGEQIFDHSTGQLVAQSLPLPYDEIALAPGLTAPLGATPGSLVPSTAPGAVTQGQVHVDQRLRTKSGELARLDLGQDFDGAGLEQTWVRGSVQSGFLHAGGFADWSDQPLPCPACQPAERDLRRLTEAWFDVGAVDSRGDGAGINLSRAIAAGAPRLSAPLDLLFAPKLAPTDPRWSLPDVDQLGFGGTARLTYGLNLHASAAYQLAGGAFSQIQFGAGYASAHRCCNLDLNAVIQPVAIGQLGFAAVFVTLDLGELAGSTQTH